MLQRSPLQIRAIRRKSHCHLVTSADTKNYNCFILSASFEAPFVESIIGIAVSRIVNVGFRLVERSKGVQTVAQ